ncbi:MAG: S9 family peptidase [Rubrivivax sp.]|nr:S9 family peptidase [Rubrivivax sp.]
MAKKKNITVEDLWQMERIGGVSLSPDGAQAVTAVTRCSMTDNKSMSSLWLLSTLGGAPRALTTCGDKDGQPRWSPHRGDAGDLIAFTAKREQAGVKDKENQLYLIAPDGGEARRAAQVATGVDAFRWSPDGRRIVFVSWVRPELKGQKAQAAAHKAFGERKETGYATSESQYRHWDHNLPQGRVPHLHLLELGKGTGEGKVRDLFEGTAYELGRADPGANDFDISPDGKRIVFAFNPAEEKRGDGRFALAEMDIRSGKATVIAQDGEWDFASPRYSPDGQRVAFTASHVGIKHTMPAQLAVWQRDGGRWEVVSAEWDHEVHAPLQWEADGSALLFCAEQKGRTHLWCFDLADRRAEVRVAGGWVSAFDKAAGTLVTVADAATHPNRMHAHLPGAEPQRIESFNDSLMATLALGQVEEVWVKGALEDPVQMWLVYPPGFDPKKTYPVMHNIHGGPHTGPGDNWHYRWNTQLFAAQGYVVASVNYHGSSGFGYAFLDSITHRWGELELQDVEAGTDWLRRKPWVDKQRIFATGGSYGGFMVAWMNGHVKPGRYQAYVCHAGCFDWVGMFADDAWSWHAKELGHWYWDDMAQVHRQSPHAFAKNFRTPTLVIHGALDYRVPDAQGLAYYNTLKAQNVDARLLWFPDENHWILKPQNSRLWYGEFFGWLRQHDPKFNAKPKSQPKPKPKALAKPRVR